MSRSRPRPVTRAAPLVGAAVVALWAACAGGPPGESAPARAEPDQPEAGPPSAPVPLPRLAAPPVRFPEAWPFPAEAEAVEGARAMVVTADSLATAAGVGVLREGGTALDAAVAVHFALAVVHPQAGNLGGGGFVVARLDDGTAVALDFRETAPETATPDMFLDARGEPTDRSWVGHLASGVPGSVAGMAALHRRFGTLPWPRLLEPAIRYAEEGFLVSPRLHEDMARYRERLARFPATAATFLPDGEPPPVGSRFRQPALARALRTLARQGPEAFYTGWIADSLATEMRRGGGRIDRADLAGYRAVWREPVRVRYRDRTVLSMPPPSSGGVTLGLMLNILEGYDLGRFEWHSPEAIHRMVETMRRAYADRNFWLGDPDFVSMPLDRLLSRAYADSLRGTIHPERASASAEFNRVPLERPSTTHYSIVDAEGSAVAGSTTLNGTFGSGVTVPGAGFLLNNEMDDFTVKVGVPNDYGLVQGEANAIRPGKRMLSSMTPTVVVAPDGRTELVTGTPGGGTIITTVLQVVTGMADWKLGPQAAVNAPRFHHQNLPDTVRYERDGLPAEVVEALRGRGHRISERSGFSGDAHTIHVAPDGRRYGAADPRRGGYAEGF